jgi:MFS family permease
MRRNGFRSRFADATTVTYGLGLGASTVTLPLLAVDAGYSPAEIGVLTAVSAVAQILVRLFLGAALRRHPDQTLVAVATVLLSLSYLAIAASTDVLSFLLAQVAQGASRASFWTGMQAHVVRGARSVTRNLARNIFIGNVGLLLGPVAAGFALEVSTQLALLLGAAVSGVATGFSLLMRRLAPFGTVTRPVQSPLRRRPPVVTGGVAAGVAGSWQGMLGSYIPVVLGNAGQSAGAIGVLVAVASAANTVSAAALARVRLSDTYRAMFTSCIAVAAGIGLFGVAASSGATAGVCLVVSGLGAGVLQILGSSVASESVHPEERGQAIALTGTVRACAMFGSPLTVAGLLQVTPIGTALGLVGLLLLAPAASLHRRRRS